MVEASPVSPSEQRKRDADEIAALLEQRAAAELSIAAARERVEATEAEAEVTNKAAVARVYQVQSEMKLLREHLARDTIELENLHAWYATARSAVELQNGELCQEREEITRLREQQTAQAAEHGRSLDELVRLQECNAAYECVARSEAGVVSQLRSVLETVELPAEQSAAVEAAFQQCPVPASAEFTLPVEPALHSESQAGADLLGSQERPHYALAPRLETIPESPRTPRTVTPDDTMSECEADREPRFEYTGTRLRTELAAMEAECNGAVARWKAAEESLSELRQEHTAVVLMLRSGIRLPSPSGQDGVGRRCTSAPGSSSNSPGATSPNVPSMQRPLRLQPSTVGQSLLGSASTTTLLGSASSASTTSPMTSPSAPFRRGTLGETSESNTRKNPNNSCPPLPMSSSSSSSKKDSGSSPGPRSRKGSLAISDVVKLLASHLAPTAAVPPPSTKSSGAVRRGSGARRTSGSPESVTETPRVHSPPASARLNTVASPVSGDKLETLQVADQGLAQALAELRHVRDNVCMSVCAATSAPAQVSSPHLQGYPSTYTALKGIPSSPKRLHANLVPSEHGTTKG